MNRPAIAALLLALATRTSSATTPATADLSAALVNPATGSTTPLTPGSTVYLGDTIQLTPAITPSAGVEPILDWRIDLDYHASTESNATFPRLKNADLFFTSSASSPGVITLVGPCDPTVAGTIHSTGAGCWTSVQTNSATGGPDFTAYPSVGSTKSLTFAFEARNADGSANLKTFGLAWKVPAVRLASTSIQLASALVDASEGHPIASGYKWYFGSAPGAPYGEMLTRETACTGPTCNHAFPGKGIYNYWLTASYPGGYTSPDYACGGGCPSMGAVVVTDVALVFSNVPTTLLKGTSSFTVQSDSTKATSVTACGNGLEYNLCDAAQAACTAGTGLTWTALTPFTGTGVISSVPTPAAVPGTLWLRIHYNYATAGCWAAQQVSWTPAVSGVSDPTAWPISISYVQPVVVMSVNGVPCPTSGPTADICDSKTNDVVQAEAQINGVTDANTPLDVTWTVSPTTGASGSYTCASSPQNNCNPHNVTFSRSGSYSLTMSGYGGFTSSPWTIGVQSASPLTATVSANPSTATVNQAISFTGSASGGSSPYTYSWDFGDSQTSTQQNPTHSYTSPYPYTVRMTVTDGAGSSYTAQTGVTITSGTGGGGGGGSVDFVISATGGGPATQQGGYYLLQSGTDYTFTPSGGTGSYAWDFKDGTTITSGGPITHTYVTAMQRTYAISVTSGSTASHSAIVSPAGGGGTGGGGTGGGGTPTIDFSLIDTATGTGIANAFGTFSVSSGQEVQFIPNPAGYSVTWDFGDSTGTSTEASPKHTYTSATDRGFAAKVTNSAGARTTHSIAVKGTAGSPLTGNYTFVYDADGSVVDAGAVPANKTIRFVGVDAADAYTWDFGDSTSLATGSPVTHAFSAAGDYTVRLTVYRSGQAVTTTPNPTVFHVLPLPEPPMWVVAGMAYNDVWQSDLTVFNPSATQSMVLSLAFLDSVSPVWDPSQLTWSPMILPAASSMSFANVLGGAPFFAAKGHWGAILVRGDVTPVTPLFTSRTYTTSAEGGTYGLSVPSSSTSGGIKPQASGATSRLIGLKESDAAYTNLGVVNLKPDSAVIEARFYDAAGAALGDPVTFNLGPYGVYQLAHVLSADPPSGAGYKAPVDTYAASLRVISGTAVYPYATVIDNVSKDPIVVTPQLAPSSTYRMPGIVRAQGANGTVWRSDVVVYNASSSRRRVYLTYWYRTPPSAPEAQTQILSLDPGQSVEANDFVKWIMRLDDNDTAGFMNSWIDFTPAPEVDGTTNTDPLLVVGKTYNNQPTGNVGLQVPGFTADDGASQGGARKRLLMTGLASGTRLRTNVAVLLLPGTAGPNVVATVEVLDDRGNLVKQVPIALDSVTGFVQLNDGALFGDIPADRRTHLSVVVDGITGNAAIGGYATIVDNISGDATFVQAVPAP